MIINVITAAMVAFGISSCASMDFECQGSYCVKKKADLSTTITNGTVTAQTK